MSGRSPGARGRAAPLLGPPEHVGYGTPDPLADLAATATPARAQHIVPLLRLAAIDDGE